ncbi:MAG: hypothetical protein AAFO03_15200 [Bacteroidota bacterium]
MRILTLWMLFAALSVAAQDTGILKLRTVPVVGDTYVKCGDSLLTNTSAQLLVGEHHIFMWSPGYESFDTLITILPDSVIYLKKILPKTPQYERHLVDIADYNRHIRNPKLIALGVSTLLTGISTVAYFTAQNRWDEVLIARDNYNAVENFFVLTPRAILDERLSAYNQAKDQYYAFGIATAVSWASTLYIHLRHRGKKKPIFSPEDPPFELSYQPINIAVPTVQGGIYHALSAKFSF